VKGGALFRTRGMRAHVDADAAAGVNDPDAFVLAFRTAPVPQSAYAHQKHRRTLTKVAERDELQGDTRAARRVQTVTWIAAARTVALIILFGVTEVFTLSRVLIALGVHAREAYTNAIILAGLAVGLIEGATRTKNRTVQTLCYIALTGTVLCLAWVRAQTFFAGGGGTIEHVVAGVIATAAAIGSGVGFHYYRRRSHAAAAETLHIRNLARDQRALDREIRTAEKAIVKHEVAVEAAAAEDAELRTLYARLHAIARARLEGHETGVPA
jgi:hypothetical protein